MSPSRPPWTTRVVQAELGLLGLVVATATALVAVLLVFLALISLDGGTGAQTLLLSIGAALVMIAGASAICTGIVFLMRGLGRGSFRAWAGTLVITVVGAVLAVVTAAALLAPALTISPLRSAVVLAAPEVLAAVLLVLPPTLRSLQRSPRPGQARPITRRRVRPAA